MLLVWGSLKHDVKSFFQIGGSRRDPVAAARMVEKIKRKQKKKKEKDPAALKTLSLIPYTSNCANMTAVD